MKVVVEHSEDPDSESAIEELIDRARQELSGVTPNAAMLFAASGHEHETLVRGIREAFEGIELMGCTTDGEVSSKLAFQEDSVTAMFFASDKVEFASGMGTGLSQDTVAATRAAVREARAKLTGEPVFCFVAAESLTTSAVTMLDGLKRELGETFPIVGGVAGDGWAFKGTRQFAGDRVVEDAVAILLLAGDVVFATGTASGWAPMGARATVTRSEGNRIYTIDGEPPLALYRHYLGPHAQVTPENPLAVFSRTGEFVLRAPFHADEDGSITFVGDVPEGAEVSLTQASRGEILDASAVSIRQATSHFEGRNGQPSAALFFACAARKQLLGTRTRMEYEFLELGLPAGTAICGFYTYGEIAPSNLGGESLFHNQTCVTLLLGERE